MRIPAFFLFFAACVSFVTAQEAPKGQLEAALSYRPVQKDVDIDIPTDEEAKQCEISLYDGRRGFIITTPQKMTLRLFLDANGDGRVDQWSYFKNGVEVYRDIDSDGNGTADQFRWLNSAGTRWGVDTKGDRTIAHWKTISAEEVSREVVLAVATNDLPRFLRVALKQDELKKLELGETFNDAVGKKIAALESGFAEAVKAVGLGKESQWYQLNAVLPGLVPSGERGNKSDLTVYENAVATVGGSGEEARQVSIGTLVRLPDGGWRTLDLPKPYDDSQYSYTFIPAGAAGQGSAAPTDNEVVTLIREVQDIQAEIPSLPAAQRPDKHKEVIVRMLRIIARSATNDDRDLWIRQLADTIMEASQRNEFPQGGEQLKILYETVRKDGDAELVAHVRSRQIMTDYYKDLFEGGDDIKAYLKWIENLEAFAGDANFEKTEAGVEAMMQLAAQREMAGKSAEEPLKWYGKVAQAAAGKPVAEKAGGAIRRLESEGKEIPFKATDADGKPFDITSLKGNDVLLCFWDSRVTEELPNIKAVVDKFAPTGLKAVGVNLDLDARTMKSTAAKLGLAWPQIHAPGGLESAPAIYWGIQNTPYMILYGKDGKVFRSNVLSAGELQQIMAEMGK